MTVADEIIDTLVIKVTGDSKSAESTLNSLISKLGQVKSGANSSSGSVNSLSDKLGTLKSTVNSLKSDNLKNFSSTVNKTMSTASATKATRAIKDSAANLGGTRQATMSTEAPSKATDIKDKVSAISDKAQSTNTGFKDWTSSLSSAWGKAKAVASTVSTVYSTAKKVASTFVSMAKTGFSKLKSAVTTVGSSIKSAFSSSIIGQFASKLSTVISSLKRIAFYRVIRTIIKNITSAFKDGINDIYQYSKTFNGEFSKNLDTLASAYLTFKNSLGAVVAPLVNTFTPLLDTILTKFTEINNKIAEMFAALSGKKTYSKAVRVTTEYAEAADSASKSTDKLKDKTEELKRSFAGLDEITVIGEQASDKNTASTSSGTGDKSGLDYSTMFVEAPTQIAGLSDDLLESIKGIDWSGLGSFFAEKINGLLDGINWAPIQQKAKDIATRIYTFINGFVADLNWTKLGQTISEGIKTALLFYVTYIEGVDWSALGSGIGKMINGLASVENAKLLARALVGWISRGLEFLTGLITTIDWAKVSDTIIAFISTFDLGKISVLATNLLNAIAEALTKIDWSGIGKAFSDGLANIDWRGLWDGVVDIAAAAFEGLGDLLGIDLDMSAFEESFKGLKEPVAELVGSFKVLLDEILPPIAEEFLPAIGTVLSNIASMLSPIITALSPVLSKIISTVSAVMEKLSPVLPVIGEAIGKIITVLSPLIDKILDMIVRIADKLAPILGDLFEIVGDIIEAASPFIDTIISTLEPVWELISGILDVLGGVLKVIKGIFNNDQASIKEGAKQIVDGVVSLVKGVFKTLLDAITLPFRFAWDWIKTQWSLVKDWFSSNVIQPVTNLFKGLWSSVKQFFSNLWSDIKNIWSSVTGWFDKNIVSPVKNLFSNLWSGIKNIFSPVVDFFKNLFSKAVSGIKSAFDGIKQWFSNLWQGIWNVIKTPVNWIIDGINVLIRGVNKISFDVPDWVPFIGGKKFGFNIPEIPKLATGGFPEDGLFYANHNELVGQFNNGRTAVANNEQIIEGIAEGVESANEEQNRLLREQNNLLRALLSKDNTISVSSITNAFVRQNQRNGVATVPVGTV